MPLSIGSFGSNWSAIALRHQQDHEFDWWGTVVKKGSVCFRSAFISAWCGGAMTLIRTSRSLRAVCISPPMKNPMDSLHGYARKISGAKISKQFSLSAICEKIGRKLLDFPAGCTSSIQVVSWSCMRDCQRVRSTETFQLLEGFQGSAMIQFNSSMGMRSGPWLSRIVTNSMASKHSCK